MPRISVQCNLDEFEYVLWKMLREKGMTQCQILKFFLSNIDKLLKDEDFQAYMKLRLKYIKVKQLWHLYLIVRKVVLSVKEHLVKLEEENSWLLQQYPKLQELIGDLWNAIREFEKELGYEFCIGDKCEADKA